MKNTAKKNTKGRYIFSNKSLSKKFTYTIICFVLISIILPASTAIRVSEVGMSAEYTAIEIGIGQQPPIAIIIVTPSSSGTIGQIFSFDGSTSTAGYSTDYDIGSITSTESYIESISSTITHDRFSSSFMSLHQQILPVANNIAFTSPSSTISDSKETSEMGEKIVEPTALITSTETPNEIEKPQEPFITPDISNEQQIPETTNTIQEEETENKDNQENISPNSELSETVKEENKEETTPGSGSIESPSETLNPSTVQPETTSSGPESISDVQKQIPEPEEQPEEESTIDMYHWDFGDGTTSKGVTTAHSYSSCGQYIVVLTFTDENDETDTDSIIITIYPEKPIVSIQAHLDTFYKLQWNEITDADFYNIYSNTLLQGSTHETYIIIPADTSMYQISAVAIIDELDLEGEKSDEIIHTQPCMTFSPVAIILFDTDFTGLAFKGKSVLFDGSESYSPSVDIEKYSWVFGDGSTGSGVMLYHTFNTAGSYTICLTITDEINQTDTTSVTITVVEPNIPPVAIISGEPIHGSVGENITFDGSKSIDPDGNVTSWSWDFGDETKGSGEVVQHQYTEKGTYIVTLTVTDNKKSVDSVTTLVIITDDNDEKNGPEVVIKNTNPGTYFLTIKANNQDGLVSYSIDWGIEGFTPKITPFFDPETAVSASQTYTKSGVYTITVISINENQESSIPTILEVTVDLGDSIYAQQAAGTVLDSDESIQGSFSAVMILIFIIAMICTAFVAMIRRKQKKQ